MVEQVVDTFAYYASWVLKGVAVFIICVGAVRAFIGFVRHYFHIGKDISTESIRLLFGRSLVLSLKFLVAANIVASAVNPTWEKLGLVAAVAALQAGLSYFLDKEIEKEEKNAEEGGDPTD